MIAERTKNWLSLIGLLPRAAATASASQNAASAPKPCWSLRVDPTVSEARPGQVATCSGRLFDVLQPDPAEIEIDEIAHALSQINRFCGHTKYPYSVAQHSIACADECLDCYPQRHDLALACLLHDAAEAYCCDIIRPVKRILGQPYRQLEDGVQEAVWRRFGIDMTPQLAAIVHEVDNSVVRAEAAELMRGSERWHWGDTRASTAALAWLTPMQPQHVRAQFLSMFHDFVYLLKSDTQAAGSND